MPISPFISVRFCFTYRVLHKVHANWEFLLLNFLLYEISLSIINTAFCFTKASAVSYQCSWLPFVAWHSFSLILFTFLYFRCSFETAFSWTSFLCISSENLFLLMGTFVLLTVTLQINVCLNSSSYYLLFY